MLSLPASNPQRATVNTVGVQHDVGGRFVGGQHKIGKLLVVGAAPSREGGDKSADAREIVGVGRHGHLELVVAPTAHDEPAWPEEPASLIATGRSLATASHRSACTTSKKRSTGHSV